MIRRLSTLCLPAASIAGLLAHPLAARPPEPALAPPIYAVAERRQEPIFYAVARTSVGDASEIPQFVSIARRVPVFASVARARDAGGSPQSRELADIVARTPAAAGTRLAQRSARSGSAAAPSAFQDGFEDPAASTAPPSAFQDGFEVEEAFAAASPSSLQDGFEDAAAAAPSSLQDGFDTDAGRAAPPRGAALGPAAPAAIPALRERSLFDLGGSVSIGGAYNFAQDAPNRGESDFRGLSRLRVDADLRLDVELPLGMKARVEGRGFRDLSYAIKKRDEFTHEVLQVYESELELKEAYVEGTAGKSIDFKVGRQVLALGTSETLRVLDVLSPIDNREPGLVDLRDLRLPVAATQVSYFTGPLRFRGIAIHESRFDDTPPFGSDFFPFAERPPGEIRPANGGSDTEYGATVTARLAAADASLQFAQYFDDEPHLDNESGLLEHSRLTLYGASLDVPVGSAVLRGEVARVRGLEFFGARGDLSRSDVLLGVDYFGLTDTTVTLELVARKLHGYEKSILQFPDAARENSFEGSLRYTASYLNDRARLTALLVVLGQQAQDGTTLRVSLDYDLRDALTLTAGVLVFEEGELPPLSAADDNDRVFVKLRYSF